MRLLYERIEIVPRALLHIGRRCEEGKGGRRTTEYPRRNQEGWCVTIRLLMQTSEYRSNLSSSSSSKDLSLIIYAIVDAVVTIVSINLVISSYNSFANDRNNNDKLTNNL